MTIKNTPMEETLTFKIFKDYVLFENDKVLICDHVPKEIPIFFYHIMPKDNRICYMPSDIYCECGCKMHRKQYTKWKMDMKYPMFKLIYMCPKCNKRREPNLDGIAKPGCNYTNDIRSIGLDYKCC